MRVVSGNISFSDSAPLTVEEMKEGEIRVTSDSIYWRVGLFCKHINISTIEDLAHG